MSETIPLIVTDLPNEQYHAGEGISSSVVKAMGKSPAFCWHNNINPDRTRDTSPNLIFGTQMHTMALEPELFWDENIMAPTVDKRTKAGKAEWQAFYDSQNGKVAVTPKDWDILSGMHDALYAHPAASDILLDTTLEVETSGYWEDPDTGLLCKYRPDARNNQMVIDYKTAVDASYEGFSRAMGNFGYHNSAAWYLEGEMHCRGIEHERFIFIVQEKVEPYQVAVYWIDPLSIELGRRQNRLWLRRLARCMAEDKWPGLNDEQAMEISLPQWKLRELG